MEITAWIDQALDHLSRCGPEGQSAVDFLRARRTRVGFRKQGPASGAFWWLDRNIYLNPRYYNLDQPPQDPRLLTLLLHEARHLQQGFLVALSVYGELDAWQVGFRLYYQLVDQKPNPLLAEILSMPLGFDRAVLRRARQVMQLYASKKYRADLLPLYPLHREIRYRLTGKP